MHLPGAVPGSRVGVRTRTLHRLSCRRGSAQCHASEPGKLRVVQDLPLLWRDPQEWERRLRPLVTALRQGDAASVQATVAQIDDAVVAGLSAFGLPRGPVGELIMNDFGGYFLAQKLPECPIRFDRSLLQRAVEDLGMVDDVIRTWVHESLHARRNFADEHEWVARHWAGYEEGLVEGLARIVCRDIAGMSVSEDAYAHYVAAHRALSEVLEVPAERLLRDLWEAAPGDVRGAFVDTVDRLWRELQRAPLARGQRQLVRSLGDRMFHTDRRRDPPGDVQIYVRTWRVALR